MTDSLVQSLFDGDIDIVGDVHGEIDALNALLKCLGYDDVGRHSDGRRLVFVGDLTDRGPDSPAVVELVKRFVDEGRAQCVLGNHELNILLNERKHDYHWFFGEESSDGGPTPAVLLETQMERDAVLTFFRSLPVALDRDDLRVVHACWDDKMIEIARRSKDAVGLHNEHAAKIEANAKWSPEVKGQKERLKCEQGARLAVQNDNPIKVLTSGKEQPTPKPFEASGKLRFEERVQWWTDYTDGPFCVFGHYSQYRTVTRTATNAFCVDFAVAKRWTERLANNPPQRSSEPFKGTLNTGKRPSAPFLTGGLVWRA